MLVFRFSIKRALPMLVAVACLVTVSDKLRAQSNSGAASPVETPAPPASGAADSLPGRAPQPDQQPSEAAAATPGTVSPTQGSATAPVPESAAPVPHPPFTQPEQPTVQPAPATVPPVLKGRRTFGIGIQAAPFPFFGPSIIYSPIEPIGIELLGEAFIDVDWIGARALLRPFPRPGHRFYFSGLVGHFVDYKFSENVFSPNRTETAFGYGAGLGFAFFFKRQSPVELNFELDYIHVSFAPSWKYDYGAFNLIMAGIGIHYYVL